MPLQRLYNSLSTLHNSTSRFLDQFSFLCSAPKTSLYTCAAAFDEKQHPQDRGGPTSLFLNIEFMSLIIAIELETTARKIINNDRYMSFLVEIP